MSAPPRSSEAQTVQESHTGGAVYDCSSASDEDADSDEDDQDNDSDGFEESGEHREQSQIQEMHVSDSWSVWPEDVDLDGADQESISSWGYIIEHGEEERPVTPTPLPAWPLGLSTRLNSSAHTDYDVVTVHGIHDDARIVWGPSDPGGLLCCLFEGNFRLMDFTYDNSDSAPIYDHQGDGIRTEANNLLRSLAEKRSELPYAKRNRPIVWACHDLGGSIVKQALVNAINDQPDCGDSQDDSERLMGLRHVYRKLPMLTAKIIFLDCPQRSKSIENLKDELYKLLCLPGSTVTHVSKKIDTLAPQVDRINVEFLETKILDHAVIVYTAPIFDEDSIKRWRVSQNRYPLELEPEPSASPPFSEYTCDPGYNLGIFCSVYESSKRYLTCSWDEEVSEKGLKKLRRAMNLFNEYLKSAGESGGKINKSSAFLSFRNSLLSLSPPTQSDTEFDKKWDARPALVSWIMEQSAIDKILHQDAGLRILYVHMGIQNRQGMDMRAVLRQLHKAIDDRTTDPLRIMTHNVGKTSIVFYFGFDRHDIRRNGIKAMIVAFLCNLASHSYTDEGRELEWAAGYLTSFNCWSLNDLITVFLHAQSSVVGRNTRIILGQIDQCDEEERRIFLQAVLKRHRCNGLHTRLLLTTTRADSFVCELLPPDSVISLENFPASLDDSLMYSRQYGTIEDKVKSLMSRRPELARMESQVCLIFEQFAKLPSLHDAILEWLACYGRGATAEEISGILQDAASNPHQIFLRSIMEMLSEKKQHTIRHIFMCIQCAAEPLTLEILAQAIEFLSPQSETRTHLFDHKTTHERVSKILDTYLRGIILWEGRNIRFSDDRFYEVSLAESGKTSGEPEWTGHSHAYMAATCLCSLLGRQGEESVTSFSVEMQGMDDLTWSPVALPRHSLVSYALRYWTFHYRAAGELRPVSLARELFQSQRKMRLWAEAVYVSSNPFTRTQKEYMSPLPYMSLCGLEDLVLDFLQTQTRHHRWNQDLWLAIAEAARNGHGKLATLLLEYAATDASGLGEAIHWAANYGPGGALDSLISKVPESKCVRWPPFILNRAVAAGLENLVSALIDAGYDLNEEDCTGTRCAIHTAIETSQDRTLKLLLDSGRVDPGVKNHVGDSPLALAIRVGNPESVRHLLGVSDSSEPTVDRLLLQAIIHANHVALALLIDAHIHVNRDIVHKIYDGDEMLIPVVEAARRGFTECTRVLLDRGADPNAGDLNASALHHAIGVAPTNDEYVSGLQAGPFLEVCLLLLDNGANPNQHDSRDPAYKDKSMLLIRAVERENGPLIEMLVDHGAKLNAADPNRTEFDTPLTLAINFREPEYARLATLMLEMGADPNLVSEDKPGCWSPLFTACYRQHDVSLVESLIKHGADIHWTNKEGGWSILHAAYDQHETLAVLLANGMDINITDDQKWTVLMLAAANNERESIELLLKQNDPKANLETESDDGSNSTAMNLACQSGCADAMKFLVEAGANINHQTRSGWFPLGQFIACERWEYMAVLCLNPVEYMLEQRPDVTLIETWSNETVLHNIKEWTPLPVVINLVEAGAPVGVVDTSGRTCLAVAIQEKNIDAARYLSMIKGVRTEMNLRHFVSPLHVASKSSTLELVKHLVRTGADPSFVEPRSSASLLYSSIGHEDRTECVKITRYLVEELGLDVNAPGGKLRFPLLRAVDGIKENSLLRYLLDHGARREAVDKFGRTVAHFLAARDNSSRPRKKFEKDADTLIKDWAEFSTDDHYGRTPLHLAAATGDRETVQFVLEKLVATHHNFDVNVADTDGWTPLMWACRREEATVADLLVDEYDADNSVRSNDLEWSPLKIARYHGWPDHSVKKMVPRANSAGRKESRVSKDEQTKPGLDVDNKKCQGCNMKCFGETMNCKSCFEPDMFLCFKCFRHKDTMDDPDHEYIIWQGSRSPSPADADLSVRGGGSGAGSENEEETDSEAEEEDEEDTD